MRLSFAAVPFLAFSLASCGNPDTPAGRAADARHESFEEMGEAFKVVTDQVKAAKPDVEAIRTAAGTINGFAPKVATWFPAGAVRTMASRPTRSQTIWTKPDEFKQAAAKLVEEAGKFNALAQAGDVAAIGGGMKALGGACKGCHDKFREPE